MTTEPASRLVLVIEDNFANRLLVKTVLARAGYQVVEAQSAEEARAHLVATRPDLILMDLQLPGEDGLSLTRRLKADPATATIPIVALTAHAMVGDRTQALAAGCDGYIAKPIDTRTLAAELAAILASVAANAAHDRETDGN